jgi:O-succinylbenzoate synthase
VSRVESIELSLIEMPLVRPFRVSFGTSTGKQCVLARVRLGGVDGWGECVADDGFPGFSGEWNEGAWVLLRDVLGPALIAADDVTSDTV